MEVGSYRYYDKKTCGLDISGMLEDLSVSLLSFLLFDCLGKVNFQEATILCNSYRMGNTTIMRYISPKQK